MNTCCPGHLGQTADGFFHLALSHHHQVCQLVYNDHHLVQKRFCIGRILLFFSSQMFIVAFNIADIVIRKFLITVIHLLHCPAQRIGSFSGICNNRNQQMRNPIIDTQFHHLGIHHDQLHFFR